MTDPSISDPARPTGTPAVRLDAGFRFAQIPEALVYDHRVTPTAVRVYACLVRHGANPGSCFPSHGRIAALIGVAKRSIQRPLRELEETGWIVRMERYGDDGGRLTDGFLIRSTALDSAPPTLDDAGPPTPDSADPPRGDARNNESKMNESKKNEKTTPARALQSVPDERGERSSTSVAVPDLFDSFWGAYPRKVGKPAARRAFTAALRAFSVDDIARGLRAWTGHWDEAGTDETFIPHPATWLNQHRFNDSPPAVPTASPTRPSAEAAVRNGSGRSLLDIMTQDADDVPEIPETTDHRPLPLEGF